MRAADPDARDRLANLLGHANRAGGVGARQQDRKFFATESRRQIAPLDGGGDGPRHALQHTIAEQVPAGVVDPLEMIDVHHQQAAARTQGVPFPGQARQLAIEGPAIAQTRQGVGIGLLAHLGQRVAQALDLATAAYQVAIELLQ